VSDRATRLGQLRRDIESLERQIYEQSRVDPQWADELRESLERKKAEYARVKAGEDFGELAADPERDAAFRHLAGRMADNLYGMMREIATQPVPMKTITDYGSFAANVSTEKLAGSLEEIGLEPFTFKMVVLPWREGARLGRLAFFSARDMTIGLHFLPDDAAKAIEAGRRGRKILQGYLAKRFAENKDSIVHEIIHMFDYVRGNPTFLKEAAYHRFSGEQQRVMYVNNPEEFNALFQQGIAAVEQRLRSLKPADRVRVYQNFDAFMAMANSTPSIQTMREVILPEWEKKLDARLWQAWQFFGQKAGVDPAVGVPTQYRRPVRQKPKPKRKKKRR
jgi:hypothetical protein